MFFLSIESAMLSSRTIFLGTFTAVSTANYLWRSASGLMIQDLFRSFPRRRTSITWTKSLNYHPVEYETSWCFGHRWVVTYCVKGRTICEHSKGCSCFGSDGNTDFTGAALLLGEIVVAHYNGVLNSIEYRLRRLFVPPNNVLVLLQNIAVLPVSQLSHGTAQC